MPPSDSRARRNRRKKLKALLPYFLACLSSLVAGALIYQIYLLYREAPKAPNTVEGKVDLSTLPVDK